LNEQVLRNQKLLNPARRTQALTATEPPSVFVLKSLLHPVVAVICLLACLLYWGEPLYGPYFLVAVLTFMGSAYFLDVLQLRPSPQRCFSLFSLADIALRWLLVIGFIWALLHLSRLSQNFRVPVLASWAFVTPIFLWLGDGAAHLLLARASVNATGLRKAVIIGLTEPGLRLEQQLARNPSLRIQVAGYFEDRQADRLPPEGLDRIIGRPAELPDFVRRNGIQIAYVTLPMTQHCRVVDMIEALRDSTVSIYFVPNMCVFDLVQARFDVLGGVPVVAVCESPFYGASGIAKRLSDLVIASMLLLACLPLLLLIALGVRLSSRGPALFKQKRYGLDGREILIYKFRSMTVTEDGDKNYRQVTLGDNRVTRFGALLRRLSLDELPQLFNVLEGTLSLVGPRPHAIAVNEQYRKLIPGYMLRHKIKPGITGWAQVNGYRGGDDLESMRKRVEFDMDYLRHWSLGLDLAIMVRTATIVWRDKSAY
jgi:putative colanic acid biosysnthesis UDP-glucose lipid carrier transferase